MSFNKLANNALWSLAGQLAPLAVAIVALPPLIGALTIDRYGFLSLALVLVGYAGLFDFGISRAMTRLVAQRLAQQDVAGARRIGGVAITYMVLLGVIGGGVLAACSGPIINRWLVLPPALLGEARHAMWLLAASIPVVLATASYQGYIEAYQQFKPLNLLRIAMGTLSYLGPLGVALLSPRLEWTIGAVIALRVVAVVAHAWVASRHCGFRYRFMLPDRPTSRALFSLGGWMTVSNVVGPIMNTMDRFILAGLVTVELVAYYATPYDLMIRAMIIPYALMAALFPMIAGLAGDTPRIREAYHAIVRMLFVSMFPVVFVAITLGGSFLRLWLGDPFAFHSTIVLQILAVGVLASALAQAPANLIHGLGEPKWMAIVHLVELPLFLIGIWYFTVRFGIAGTAFTWTARTILDCLIMFALVNTRLTRSSWTWRLLLPSAGVAGSLMAAGFFAMSAIQSLLLCVLGLALFAVVAWRNILTPSDKARIASLTTGAGRPVGDAGPAA